MLALLLLSSAVAALALWLWLKRDRKYQSSDSVAAAYDAWTDDRLLERLWGDHVHLGHYGDPPRHHDFREAKAAFVHELVRWSGLDQLPAGSKVLDVGCGIGGSARILARDYNLRCRRHQHQSRTSRSSHRFNNPRPELSFRGDGCTRLTDG